MSHKGHRTNASQKRNRNIFDLLNGYFQTDVLINFFILFRWAVAITW